MKTKQKTIPKKKPFDWAKVKPGMAFKFNEKDFGYFVGIDRDGYAVLDIYHVPNMTAYNGWLPIILTRSPKNDIKVQS